MPLSDHEKQLLEQIEQNLAAEQSPRPGRPRWRHAVRLPQPSVLVAVLGVLAGFALLYLGLRTAGADPSSRLATDLGTVLAVLAYLVITLACHAGTRTVLDQRRRPDPADHNG